MHNLKADEKEAQNIQQVDVSAKKHVKSENPLFGWTATDRPLEIPPHNLSHVSSTLTEILFKLTIYFRMWVVENEEIVYPSLKDKKTLKITLTRVNKPVFKYHHVVWGL